MQLPRYGKTIHAAAATLARKRSLRAMASSFLAAISARALALIMVIVIARRLGPDSYGTFAFATGIATLAGQLGSLGWPVAVTRLIPTYHHEQDWARLRGLNFSAMAVTLGSMITIAAVLALAAWFFLDRTNPLYIGLLFAASLTIPSGMRLLNRQRLSAIGRAATGTFVDESMAPLFILVGCLVLVIGSDVGIYSTYALGTYASALLAWLLYRHWAHPEAGKGPRTVDFRAWMMISLPMVTAIASRVALQRIDAIMIAPLSSVYEAGLFNTSLKIAVLATMLPAMTNPVIRPLLARANAAARHAHVARIMRWYYAFTVVLAAFLSVVTFVFAREILGLAFGQEYVSASSILQILAVASFFDSVTESSTSYLLMCGRERIFGVLSTASFAVAVLANLWVIPRWGAEGAAVVTALVNFLFLVFTVTTVARTIARRASDGDMGGKEAQKGATAPGGRHSAS